MYRMSQVFEGAKKAMLCFSDTSVEPIRERDGEDNAREVVFRWV